MKVEPLQVYETGQLIRAIEKSSNTTRNFPNLPLW